VLFSGFLREDDQLLSELIRLAAFAGLVARVPYDQDHEPNFGELWEQATEAVQEIRERKREARRKAFDKIAESLERMEEALKYEPFTRSLLRILNEMLKKDLGFCLGCINEEPRRLRTKGRDWWGAE